MNKKRNFALNKLFNYCVIIGLLLARVSYEAILEKDPAWAVGIGIAALLFIILPSIFTPFCYSFDKSGVSFYYVFLPNERYLWKDVYAIEVENISSGRASVLDLFYASVFSLKGKGVGKTRFYMTGNIRKSFRTKYLLEKYWDGTITGYLFEDTKKWIAKKKAKKQTVVSQHLTDEIVPMEREIRANAREWLDPFISDANRSGIEIKVKYCYVTSDFDELNSRPDEGYTYTLCTEIARLGETDENRIIVVDIDLLYVRLGKTAYRGVHNDGAKEELESTLSYILDEISKNGIEAVCDDN